MAWFFSVRHREMHARPFRVATGHRKHCEIQIHGPEANRARVIRRAAGVRRAAASTASLRDTVAEPVARLCAIHQARHEHFIARNRAEVVLRQAFKICRASSCIPSSTQVASAPASTRSPFRCERTARRIGCNARKRPRSRFSANICALYTPSASPRRYLRPDDEQRLRLASAFCHSPRMSARVTSAQRR